MNKKRVLKNHFSSQYVWVDAVRWQKILHSLFTFWRTVPHEMQLIVSCIKLSLNLHCHINDYRICNIWQFFHQKFRSLEWIGFFWIHKNIMKSGSIRDCYVDGEKFISSIALRPIKIQLFLCFFRTLKCLISFILREICISKKWWFEA